MESKETSGLNAETEKPGRMDQVAKHCQSIMASVAEILEVTEAPTKPGTKLRAKAAWQDARDEWSKLRASIEELGK